MIYYLLWLVRGRHILGLVLVQVDTCDCKRHHIFGPSAFQFIPKVFSRVQVWGLCRPVQFFPVRLNTSFLYGHLFVHRDIVRLEEKSARMELHDHF